MNPLIKIENLSIYYPKQLKPIIKNLNLEIFEGEIIGLVGASGCGKSTIAKAIVGITPINQGRIYYQNKLLLSPRRDLIHNFRKEIQLVFQDPLACLNPRMSVLSILLEPLMIHDKLSSKATKIHKVCKILEQVGLDSSFFSRYSHELSGGQRQRICIARSLILNPKFLIFDEAVSALDASIQAQILNLLKTLKNELGFTLLFISHDLEIVHYISDRVAVMASGDIAEINTPEEIFHSPQTLYTKRLVQIINQYSM